MKMENAMSDLIERLRESADKPYDMHDLQGRAALLREAADALEAARADAERLKSAFDHIARVGLGSRKQTKRTQWIVARAISAINGDDEWRSASKPVGYHDALERDAMAAEGREDD